MNVEQPAARKDFFELILQQLIHAGAAGYDHGLDVEVIEGIGHAMEQHAIFGSNCIAFICLPAGGLRITAAQIAWRQHGLRAEFEQHGLCRQPDL